MLTISMWIVGIALIIYDIYGLVVTILFARGNKELTKIEIEMMKKDGLLEGEPEYMRDFRVARSESDLETDKIILGLVFIHYTIPLVVGLVLVGYLVVRAWH